MEETVIDRVDIDLVVESDRSGHPMFVVTMMSTHDCEKSAGCAFNSWEDARSYLAGAVDLARMHWAVDVTPDFPPVE